MMQNGFELTRRFTCVCTGRHTRAEFRWGLTKDPFECAIELRERLKPNIVRDLANAKISIQQAIAGVFQAYARDVVSEL